MKTSDIEKAFDAKSRSVWGFLSEDNVGFHIPSYQRPYSWGKERIRELFSDTAYGLLSLIKDDNKESVVFIGSIILVRHSSRSTDAHHIAGDPPTMVYHIIDGQQRATTLSLICCLLHEQLKLYFSRIEKLIQAENLSEEAIIKSWLSRQSRILDSQLLETVVWNNKYSDDRIFRYYPKIIRSQDDIWAGEARTAQYNSSIASYIHSYYQHHVDDKNSPHDFKQPQNYNQEKAQQYKLIYDNCIEIRKLIDVIARGGDDSLDPPIELPTLRILCEKTRIQEEIFGQNQQIPSEIAHSLTSSSKIKLHQNLQRFTRIVLFAQHLLHRVALTVVVASNEDYAFDMFERLNTSGTPLTAFETFKPSVVRFEDVMNSRGYRKSPSREYITSIENYLKNFLKPDEKLDATHRLLIPFALAESGKQVLKRFSDQRKYLKTKNVFDNLELEQKRDFLLNMANVSVFIKDVWPKTLKTPSQFSNINFHDAHTTRLCIHLLRSSKHNITIAPLTRYYSQILIADKSEAKEHAIHEFESVAKAIVAFFVFWRGSRIGTDSIDGVYRELMENGIETIISPLARRPHGNCQPLPSANKLCLAFRTILANGLKQRGKKAHISSKVDWIEYARQTPIYTNSKPLTRFMVMAALDGTLQDPHNAGLVIRTKKDVFNQNSLLTIQNWSKGDLSVEHVAPITDHGGWDTELTSSRYIINSIGNLTLLPVDKNGLLGNRPWKEKQAIYRMMACETNSEIDKILQEPDVKALKLKPKIVQNIKTSEKIAILKAFQDVKEWNKSIVDTRGARLAELIWDRIAPWLQYEV